VNNKKLIIIVLLAVLIGVMFGVTFGIVVSSLNSPEPKNVKIEYVDQDKDSSTIDEDKEDIQMTNTRVDGWDTFTDNQYFNLSLKHPADYTPSLSTLDNSNLIRVNYLVEDTINSNDPLDSLIISIESTDSNYKDLSAPYTGEWDLPQIVEINGVEINGEAFITGEGGPSGSTSVVTYIYKYNEETFLMVHLLNSQSATWCAEPDGAWSEEGCNGIQACEFFPTCEGYIPTKINEYKPTKEDIENAIYILESVKFL
jgi:hypothetical protein